MRLTIPNLQPHLTVPPEPIRVPLSSHCAHLCLHCWGKWPSEAPSTSGQADGFGSHATLATRGSFRNAGLTRTLMLLKLCEFCCAGAAHLSSTGLRCRRYGQSCFGAEGSKTPGAPHAGNTSGRGWERHGRDVLEGNDAAGAKVLGCFGSKGAMRCDTWLLQHVKRAPYKAETRSAACKGVSAVRRHAGGLYDVGSYCYTLVKCLKPFVRNGRGVIEENDYA
jgi:hypothetical protein